MVSFQVMLNIHYDASTRQRTELELRLRKFLLDPDGLLGVKELHIPPHAVAFDTSIVRLDCTRNDDEV